MPHGEHTVTVFLLASRQEAHYVDELWKHTAVLRRQFRTVTWVSPLYVEDMARSHTLVPAMPTEHALVIGCMSPSVVAALLEQPACSALVQHASRRVPVIFSPCAWDQPPCPFQGLMPATTEAISTTSQRDRVFVEVVRRIRGVLTPVVQGE